MYATDKVNNISANNEIAGNVTLAHSTFHTTYLLKAGEAQRQKKERREVKETKDKTGENEKKGARKER
jgi:hypothetical protein